MKISFREIEIDDAKMILDWRTSPYITKYMITDIEYNINKQKEWIIDSRNRRDFYHWIIICNDISIGYICVHDFDIENLQTHWGFYKGDIGFPGSGSKIVPYLYNMLFFKIGIKNILTEAFFNNNKVLDLYLSYGLRFTPDKDKVIVKNGREILLIALSISRDEWDKEKYKDSVAAFPTLYWQYSPIHDS